MSDNFKMQKCVEGGENPRECVLVCTVQGSRYKAHQVLTHIQPRQCGGGGRQRGGGQAVSDSSRPSHKVYGSPQTN